MTCANQSPPLGLSLQNITVATGVTQVGLGLGIGSPLQLVALYPSVADDETFVSNADTCASVNDLQCYALNGGAYNSSASLTYAASTLQTWNGTGLDSYTVTQLNELVYFNDKVVFGSNGSILGMPLVMEQKSQTQVRGLGLGKNSTFLSQAVRSGSAPSRNWGLWTGSQSINNPVDGALWIGGYDQYRATGNLTPFTSTTTSNCLTCAIVTGLSYISTSGTSTSLFSNSSQALKVGLQPSERYLEVSNDIYTNFLNLMMSQGVFNDYIQGVATYKNVPLGNISVTLQNAAGGSYNTIIPPSEFFQPNRLRNTNGQLYIQNNTWTTDLFWNVSSDDSYIFSWGRPLLNMNYMVMDYDEQMFSLAPARQGAYSQSSGPLVKPLCSGLAATSVVNPTGPTSTNNPSTSSSTAPSSKHSTPVGAIAGGVIGGVAVLIIIALLAWYILRGKKREKTLKNERDSALAVGSEMGQRHEVMSEYTATSPTVVSEVHAGGKAHDQHNSINSWLNTQGNTHSTLEPVNNHTTPTSPTLSQAHASQNTGTMNEPFEMPAYQYR